MGGPRSSEPPPWTLVAAWVGLGLCADLFFGLKARRLLYSRFRHLAMPYGVAGR
jgi:hypothetical protein